MVKLLLKYKANPNLVSIPGRTALLHMAGCFDVDFNYQTVKLLLEHGACPNIQDRFGATPLQFATNYCWDDSLIETVKLLLEYNADVNLVDQLGNTPFVLAFDRPHKESYPRDGFPPPRKRNNNEVLKLLWSAKTDINLITNRGITEMNIIIALHD